MPEFIRSNLYTNSVNLSTGEPDEIGFVDVLTGECVAKLGGVPRGREGHVLRVSRLGFRNFLLNSCNLPVTMGKNFSHYTQEAGKVIAHFKDGSSAIGTLLIGADGVHSHVLNQLVGQTAHRPQLSEWVPTFGEVKLPQKLFGPIRERGNAVILAGGPGVRSQLGMLHMDADLQNAMYFWTIMYQRKDPESLSEWTQTATKQEMYNMAVEAVKVWHPSMSDLIRYGGPEAIVAPPPRFVEFEPPDTLPVGRVAVLGDAAHAMIPFRGAGANTAILDACDLGELLTGAFKEDRDLSSVVTEYNRRMVPRGQYNVRSSRAAGQGEGNPAEKWAKIFEREK